jgi:hypothetical protein
MAAPLYIEEIRYQVLNYLKFCSITAYRAVLLNMKIKAIIFVAAITFLSCHKDKPLKLDTNLTDCPASRTCMYHYYQQADFVTNQLQRGNFRLFEYRSTGSSCVPSSEFYLKTPLSASNFTITSTQIAAGQIVIAFVNNCPCCYYSSLTIPAFAKPVGGEIKGQRMDTTHWLINARILFGASSGAPTDSIKVNQYFTLTSLP